MALEEPARLMERAFEIARSGKYPNIGELKLRLRKDGFSAAEVDAHLQGSSIRRQLTELIAKNRA